MRRAVFAFLLLLPLQAFAGPAEVVKSVVDHHILPQFSALSDKAGRLADAAEADCDPHSAALTAAYHEAFDAWVRASHLRFGPTDVESRAFAIAFWPDPRGKTPSALAGLIRDRDAVIESPDAFKSVSIAARGFYALERLLYAPQAADDTGYACDLTKAVARDIAITAAEISADWKTRYGDLLVSADEGDSTYRSHQDVLRELYKSLTTGLQFAAEVRLARPLGTFERPRPRRAEAHLSERSLRHVTLSLEALEQLAFLLAADHPGVGLALSEAFARAAKAAERIADPALQSVSTPQGRLRVEVLQQRITAITDTVRNQLGPALGVSEGFNALDGD